MKKWCQLGEATTPDGKILSLRERDGEYAVFLGGIELMSSRRTHSETTMAELVCADLAKKEGIRILIGGLGMGFTLQAVLGSLPGRARVTVAELSPAIVEWNRNAAWDMRALDDPRTEVIVADVFDVMAERPERFDAILLDVDNGPIALTVPGNQRLYEAEGLRRIKSVLKAGGTLAVWSVEDSRTFVDRLSAHGFRVEVHHTTAHASGGGKRLIFLARK